MRGLLILTFAAFWALAARAADPARSRGPSADGRYAKWEPDGVMIEVHRSMRLVAPENSLAAARQCYLAGGDAVDCDVRMTLDGVVITFHDRDPSLRGSGTFYPIAALTWREAAEVLIEPLSYPDAKQTIPRFEDVLRGAIANNMAVYIDPKDPRGASRAKAIMSRYKAGHLLKFPRWPLVYYWTTRKDHDLAALKALLAATELDDIRAKKKVTLAAGAPRSLRVDDPRILAAITGRNPKARGPWRKPAAVVAAPAAKASRPARELSNAISAGGRKARLAADEMCDRFAVQARKLALAGLKDTEASSAQRVEYLWMLGRLGNPSAGGVLADHLADKDPRVRELAAYGLGRLKAAGAIDALVKAASDDDPMAAGAAAWALWRIGDPRTAGAMLRALEARLAAYKEGDHQPVRMLLLGLGTFKSAAAVAVIYKHMAAKAQADNVNVAIAALGSVGGKKAVAVAAKLYRAHGRAADENVYCRALAVAGPAGTPELVRGMISRGLRLPMDATLTLAVVPDAAAAVARFVKAGTLGPAAKRRVISMLLLHEDPAAKALLGMLAGDSEKSVAAQAKWALGRKK